MADLTTNQSIRFWGIPGLVEKRVLDNSAAQTVKKGGPIIIDASEDAKNVRGYFDAVTIATGDTFIGIAAEEKVVATSDTEADNEIKYHGHDRIVGLLMSQYGTFTNADLGEDIHFSDSGTLTTTLGTSVKAGVIHAIDIEDGYVYIRIVAPFDVA